MAIACLLGHKFSTVTMLKQFIPYQEDLVRLYRFDQKCASVRAININVENATIERERTLAELKEEFPRSSGKTARRSSSSPAPGCADMKMS